MTYDSDAIASDLRVRIEAGRLPADRRPADALPPGSQLPTVDALAETFGVHRNTAHQAQVALRAAGLIHTMKGRNATVADPSPLYVITSDAYEKAAASTDSLTAWELQVAEIGEEGRTVHYVGQLSPGVDLQLDGRGSSVANLFGDEDGQYVHLAGDGWSTPIGPTGEPDRKLERVVQIYDGWFAADLAELAPEILEERDGDTWRGGAFALIERATGRAPRTIRRLITNRISTKAEEVRFHVPPMTPISAEVEVLVEQATGGILAVLWYRRLFGVAQWDLA
ncbi:MAG TPA: GntR family transcriptional regulator [Actinomycetota bacterium]|nr:GntR family transcriptional regulator [Actinomycetota bacterium]